MCKPDKAETQIKAMEMPSEEISATGDGTDVYHDCPLARGNSDNIRVLEILPSAATDGLDTISCRIRVISVDYGVDFTAVSYVWGKPDVTKRILVDGSPLTVRVNIWNFLSQMRDEGYIGLLWIDAICINQMDVAERSHQVGLMGRVYSKATDVLVWLGTKSENEDISQALQLLSKPRVAPLGSTLQTPLQNWELWTVFQWKVLSSLCSAEYWSRLWIVQEFILAQTLEIRCGGMVLGIDSLYDLRDLLLHIGDTPERRFEPSLEDVHGRCTPKTLTWDTHRWTMLQNMLYKSKDPDAYLIDKMDSVVQEPKTLSTLMRSIEILQGELLQLRSCVKPRSIVSTLSLLAHIKMGVREDKEFESLRKCISCHLDSLRNLESLSVKSSELNLHKLTFDILMSSIDAQEQELEMLQAATDQVDLTGELRKILKDTRHSTAMKLVSHRFEIRHPETGRIDRKDDLFEIIYEYLDAQCSDPRDHVYALLALTQSPDSLFPDYSKSATELFRDIFDMLKRRLNFSYTTLGILQPLSVVGSALRLRADDEVVRLIFREIGAEWVVRHGTTETLGAWRGQGLVI